MSPDMFFVICHFLKYLSMFILCYYAILCYITLIYYVKIKYSGSEFYLQFDIYWLYTSENVNGSCKIYK